MSKTYLLDTNIVSAYWKREQSVVHRVEESDFAVSAITIGELLKGALRKDYRVTLLRNLRILVSVVPVLSIEFRTAEQYGVITAQLENGGNRLEDNDVWIAATARQHHLVLATRDAHFNRIPDLLIENW